MKILRFHFFSIFFLTSLAFSFENQNTVALQTTGYLTHYSSASQREYQFSLLTENHFQIDSNSQFKISPTLRVEQESFDSKTIFDLDAKEFLFNYSNSRNNIDIGFLNLKKEGPDIFDIWGYFQPKNYKSFLNISTMPVLGICTESEITKSLSVTFALVPQNRISKIPSKNSMWLPRENNLPLASEDTVAELPAVPAYEIGKNESEKKQDLQNNYLVRLKYSVQQVDAIIQVAESISNTPEVTPTLTGQLVSINPTKIQLDNPIFLDFKWKKNKNYGLGINYSFNDAGIIAKMFSNYTVTPDDESVQYVAAIEKQFENLVLVYEHTKTDKKNNVSSNNLASMNSLFSNAHALALLFSASDSFKFKIGGFLNLDMRAFATLFSAGYQISDSWSIYAQYLNISAEQNSILGFYEKNDAFSLKLSSLF